MDTVKPAEDELEVSLFGPGIGESIVVHLGGGAWAVVDSCVEPGTTTPIALAYLEQLGVAPSAIKLIVITHWHDDHIRGIGKVVEAATEADICCSAALNGQEFLEFLAYHCNDPLLANSTGVDEMHSVFVSIKSARASSARAISTGPHWTKANECLWRGDHVNVHALSPSSGALTLALREFGDATATIQPRRRAVAQTRNEVAVALWVEVEGGGVLLGSDLEESTDANCGWQAIVASRARPPGHARAFKVPHHGSVTAHSTDVWNRMLAPKPNAFLTTFTSGSRPLPSDQDIARIRESAGTFHATTPPRGWSPSKRDKAVERTLKEVARNRRRLVGKMGHVRLRQTFGADAVKIDKNGSAIDLMIGSA